MNARIIVELSDDNGMATAASKFFLSPCVEELANAIPRVHAAAVAGLYALKGMATPPHQVFKK